MKLTGTLLLVLTATTTIAASAVVTPVEAIRVAVLQRLGVSGVAEVTHVRTKVADEAGLVAEPEATARLGKPSRFVLSVGGVRRGVAVATVTVVCRHAKASRSIARDEAIDGSAIHSRSMRTVAARCCAKATSPARSRLCRYPVSSASSRRSPRSGSAEGVAAPAPGSASGSSSRAPSGKSASTARRVSRVAAPRMRLAWMAVAMWWMK